MMRTLRVLLVSLWTTSALAADKWSGADLDELGLDDATRAYHTEPTISFGFATRGDQVLTDARLRLDVASDANLLGSVTALQVLVNGEEVDVISQAKLTTSSRHDIAVDSRLLSETNSLTLRLVQPGVEDACGASVPAGTWNLLEGGRLETKGSALPLRSDLAILPLPFYDGNTDVSPTIPFVFVGTLDDEVLRAGGLMSGWFGLLAGSKARFPVTLDALPDSSAVVVVAPGGSIPGVTLPPAKVGTLAMVDHPTGQLNDKLLVVYGPDSESLVQAARGLLVSPQDVYGAAVAFSDVREPGVQRAYSAPRWLPPVDEVTFGSILGEDRLVHEGLQGGTMSIDFRIAPDLFAWPRDLLRLDVDYRQIDPWGRQDLVPSVIVELNGKFVQRLPRVRPSDEGRKRTALIGLHRSQLRGFNRLSFHVKWPEGTNACDEELGDDVRTEILPSSTIHFDDVPHFAAMPNVESFVEDGFPFTRRPDLAETAILLSDEPTPGELGTYLSLMGHFAAVTGTAPHHAAMYSASEFSALRALNKDLLVIGEASDLPAGSLWTKELPLDLNAGRVLVHAPEPSQQALDALRWHLSAKDAKELGDLIKEHGEVGLVFGTRSPLGEGRSVVVVTATRDTSMPAAADLIGFTTADSPGGDTLLVVGDDRWRFQLGPVYDVGTIDGFTRLRWVLATHWLVLIPALLFGVLMMARSWRWTLTAKERARLGDLSSSQGGG